MKRLFLTLLLLSALSGCGRDASDLTVVTGLSIDGTAKNYQIGADVIKLNSNEQETQNTILRAEGASVADAVAKMVSMTGKTLYCNHAQMLLLSRETAEENLLPLLEEMLCDNQYPLSLRLCVVKGKSLPAMRAKSVIGDLHSLELCDMIRNSAAEALTADMNICSFYRDICDEGIEGVLPFLELRQEGDAQICMLAGTALFRGDRMVTVLNADDSKSLMWLRGNSGGSLETPEGSFKVVRLKRKLNATESGAELALFVTLKTNMGGMMEETEADHAALLFEKRCADLLEELKALQCDAVGIGQHLFRTDPLVSSSLSSYWPQTFADYPVKISVTIENIIWGRTWSENER